jgi:hypothetical protein
MGLDGSHPPWTWKAWPPHGKESWFPQHQAEARIRRFDGAYRWFLFRANPLPGESGNIVKWYGTNLDIEDRKRGEEALTVGAAIRLAQRPNARADRSSR